MPLTRAAWLAQDWITQSKQEGKVLLWRAVEAQHQVATVSLVDTLDEQAVLEQILEANKPPLPAPAQGLHWLIFTPYRYTSPHPSRFRKADEPGIWYGAEDRQTACAEVGYWRWRFLMDSEGLRGGEVKSQHTLFQARASGSFIDLSLPPWSKSPRLWRSASDYRACQQLARTARERGLGRIRYASVRYPFGVCAAVLDPKVLSLPAATQQQSWACKITAALVIFLHEKESFSFVPTEAGLRQKPDQKLPAQ